MGCSKAFIFSPESQKVDSGKEAENIVVYGCSRKGKLRNHFYDSLFTAKLTAKNVILRCRGVWDSCHCPIPRKNGQLIDNIKKEYITNLEMIQIGSTFQVSSCALLDLIARSPNLKTLIFSGTILKQDHEELFSSKRFLCSLDRIDWLWPKKDQIATLNIAVRRNEKLTTLITSAEATSSLLSSESIPELQFLSINLNENWSHEQKNIQRRAYRYIQALKYLSTAKGLRALEVRTYDIPLQDQDLDEKVPEALKNLFEDYQLTFWGQVAKLPNLKFLAVYGAWNIETVCREMSKHMLQIEFLKINLIPKSLADELDDRQNDKPDLSMTDGVRYLRKLLKLKSLYYICHDKLGNIDAKTVDALKELIDVIWKIDIKVLFTTEVEDLLLSIIRRWHKSGKICRVTLVFETKLIGRPDIMVDLNLKYTTGINLREKFKSIADVETKERYGESGCKDIRLWGIEQVDNTLDKPKYEQLAAEWQSFDEKFERDFTVP